MALHASLPLPHLPSDLEMVGVCVCVCVRERERERLCVPVRAN